jgi:hypothetical protein
MIESLPVKNAKKSKQQSLPKGFPTETDIDQYPTLAIMRRLRVPMTREKYLELEYLTPNPKLDAEAESELPEPFRRNL